MPCIVLLCNKHASCFAEKYIVFIYKCLMLNMIELDTWEHMPAHAQGVIFCFVKQTHCFMMLRTGVWHAGPSCRRPHNSSFCHQSFIAATYHPWSGLPLVLLHTAHPISCTLHMKSVMHLWARHCLHWCNTNISMPQGACQFWCWYMRKLAYALQVLKMVAEVSPQISAPIILSCTRDVMCDMSSGVTKSTHLHEGPSSCPQAVWIMPNF